MVNKDLEKWPKKKQLKLHMPRRISILCTPKDYITLQYPLVVITCWDNFN